MEKIKFVGEEIDIHNLAIDFEHIPFHIGIITKIDLDKFKWSGDIFELSEDGIVNANVISISMEDVDIHFFCNHKDKEINIGDKFRCNIFSNNIDGAEERCLICNGKLI